jgi:hypothetical protein
VNFGRRSAELAFAAFFYLEGAVAKRMDNEALPLHEIDEQAMLVSAGGDEHPAQACAPSEAEAAFAAALCRCHRETAAALAIFERASGGSFALRASLPRRERRV